MKQLFFGSIFFLVISTTSLAKIYKTIEFSIPKSGTHLLARALHLISDERLFFAGRIVSETELEKHIAQLGNNQFLVAHQTYSKPLEDYLQKNNVKLLLMYRDPRDQIVSFSHFIYKYPELWPTLQTLSMDDLISHLITEHNYADHGLSIYTTATELYGIDALYRAFMPWMNFLPTVCPVRFEDLIGPQGGGDTPMQQATIQRIANYLSYTINEKKMRHITANLFGNTYSFREGKIGEWKRYFNQKHRETFKQIADQLLIDLGYEKDLNW